MSNTAGLIFLSIHVSLFICACVLMIKFAHSRHPFKRGSA